MQDDASAFEAWALVLHRWCGAARVELRWESVTVQTDLGRDAARWPPKALHYQRFLYRLRKFHELFGGEWFRTDLVAFRRN
jgi:hypothetical protein